MKNILLASLFFAAVLATQSCANKSSSSSKGKAAPLQMSAGLSVENDLPESKQALFLPNLNSTVMEGKLDQANYKIRITSSTPPTFVNSFSVERYWHESLEETRKTGQSSKDLGCHAVNSYLWECKRESDSTEKPAFVESLYWYRNEKLVLIHSGSEQSLEHARLASTKIHLKTEEKGGR